LGRALLLMCALFTHSGAEKTLAKDFFHDLS
jgi:hypothetical protein